MSVQLGSKLFDRDKFEYPLLYLVKTVVVFVKDGARLFDIGAAL